MKIVIDDKIPFIKNVFEPFADVVYCKGSLIDKALVSDADALIVRTRTICDCSLLKGSCVKIIASATIGYDHIDTRWCRENGIVWVNAPGCNSGSVKQYITAALFHLVSLHSLDLSSLTLGVVGVGNVGSKVVSAARAIGMNVLQNDPPREKREKDNQFVPLDDILQKSDIITIHVPYTKSGDDKTHHLISSKNLHLMKPGSFLFNSSRGEVVDNAALLNALEKKHIAGAVLDVWENEPDANRELINLADIATPHIAGYSVDGKANGTIISVRNVAAFLNLPLNDWTPQSLPQPSGDTIDLRGIEKGRSPLELAAMAVEYTYPVYDDSTIFKNSPDKFEFLRDNYRKRREFPYYTVEVNNEDAAKILSSLGFKTKK